MLSILDRRKESGTSCCAHATRVAKEVPAFDSSVEVVCFS